MTSYQQTATWNSGDFVAWPPALVSPVECDRCSGRGNVGYGNRTHLGQVGKCFTCHGHGKVEGDEATIERTKAEAREARRQERRYEKLRAWEAAQALPGGGFTEAQIALWALQYATGSWERWNEVVDLIAAGDVASAEALLAA
jgi:hypothetical protein